MMPFAMPPRNAVQPNCAPVNARKPTTSSPSDGPVPVAAKKLAPSTSSCADQFPKLPLVTELAKKYDVFAEKMAPFYNYSFAPRDFAAVKGSLTPVEPVADLFGTADTRVFVRARPILAGETDRVPVIATAGGYRETILLAPKIELAGGCSVAPFPLSVDATFSPRDTNEVVHHHCAELLELAIRGGSSSLLCYGQTGSGKTFTTIGLLQHMAWQFENAILDGTKEVTATFVEIDYLGCRDLIKRDQEVQVCEVGTEVKLKDSVETKVQSADQLLALVERAIAARSTKATARNSGSSRSHMVARFLIKSVETPWAAPGVFSLADLAGSESTADAATHDKERIVETKFINSSLMTLKDCIRARGIAASSSKHVHIPYRNTSLTLILKDSFELIVKRPTKTAVIACVSPLLQDVRHTANTLRYASLLYISPKQRVVLDADPDDPNNWSRETALEALVNLSRGKNKTPEVILPEGDGRALVLIPEADFVARAMQCGFGEKAAKGYYVKVWELVVDARTKTQKALKSRGPLQKLVNQS
jgi:kinesin family protein 2/24